MTETERVCYEIMKIALKSAHTNRHSISASILSVLDKNKYRVDKKLVDLVVNGDPWETIEFINNMRGNKMNIREAYLEYRLQKENKMDIREAYLEYQKNCGIEVGDYVRVLFKVPDYCGGWDDHWTPKMDKMVGETFEVLEIGRYGIHLNGYVFPAFCLQKVENPNKQEEMIEIDGKKFSISTIKQALKDHCSF